MAFFISMAHFLFCSRRAFCVSCRSLIFCNKSLFPPKEEDEDAPALLGSEGAGTGEVGAADAAVASSVGDSSAPEMRPSAVSVMAQASEAKQPVVSKGILSYT